MVSVFLGWSDDLTNYVAKQFYERLMTVLPGKVEPFLSSQSILPGSPPFTQIAQQLKDSNHGLVFLARNELNPPWVVFEAGAIGKDPQRSTVTPIAVGFSPGDIDVPLRIMHQGVSISNEEKICQIFNEICKDAGGDSNDFTRVNGTFSEWFANLQGEVSKRLARTLSGGTDWSLVRAAKVAEVTRNCPFEMKDAMRLAIQQVVFVGQNLFSVIGKDQPIESSWFWRECLTFLRGKRTVDEGENPVLEARRIDLMIIDPNEPHLKEAWGCSIGDESGFLQHLNDCVQGLRQLRELAKREGVSDRVKIRLAKYIPLSATFIDPEDMVRGMLFLRPFTRGDAPNDRPIVLLTRESNPRAFDFYWTRHDADFENRLYSRKLDDDAP